jgi:hypothetical protein
VIKTFTRLYLALCVSGAAFQVERRAHGMEVYSCGDAMSRVPGARRGGVEYRRCEEVEKSFVRFAVRAHG